MNPGWRGCHDLDTAGFAIPRLRAGSKNFDDISAVLSRQVWIRTNKGNLAVCTAKEAR